MPGKSDGLVDIVKLLGNIDIALHHFGVLAVVWASQRVGEVRSLLVDHLHSHAHGLGDHENVREDDGSVDEPGIALNGLQRQSGSDLGVPAAFEEVAGSLRFVVLGEIATSWLPTVSIRRTPLG